MIVAVSIDPLSEISIEVKDSAPEAVEEFVAMLGLGTTVVVDVAVAVLDVGGLELEVAVTLGG